MINYFTSTTDSPKHKACFCGRQTDIRSITNWITNGKNIAIIGETRIGKTFLRYILRDICTGNHVEYFKDMIDCGLASQLAYTHGVLSKVNVIDLSLHTVREGELFYTFLAEELVDLHLLKGPLSSEIMPVRLLKQLIRKEVIPNLKETNNKLVIILDEFDVILEYSNALEVLGLLKEISEEFECVSLLILGWRGILDRIRDKYNGYESTFADCIEKKIYLSPFALEDAKTLIDCLAHYPFAANYNENVINGIFLLTGGRPNFIQYTCDLLINNQDKFDIATTDFLKFADEVADCIYQDTSVRKVIESIWCSGFNTETELLAYVAHYPGSTLSNIKSFFSKFRDFEINDCINRLVKYGLFDVQTEDKTFIKGLLIEKWGKSRKENPVVTYSRQKIEDEYTNIQSFSHVEWTPPTDDKGFNAIILKLIHEYRHNVEQKKGTKLLWLADKPAPEEHAQILFDVIADQYAKLADIVIDREIETGRGPVDFKFSKGHKFQAHLEVKRATSTQLEHGLKKQLPTYLAADKVENGYYLVICYVESDFVKANELIKEAESLSTTLNINLQVAAIKAYKKFESASKVTD